MNRPADVLPAPSDKRVAVRTMFDTIAPRYDLVNRIMTFGLDVRWRRRTVVGLALDPGSLVADLASGTGDFSAVLEAAGHRPLSIDLSHGMLAHAHAPTPRIQADISRLPLTDDLVDATVCGFALRNVTDLDAVLADMARVTRDGGRLGLLEVDRPMSPMVRFGHGLYFDRIVPRIGGALSDRDAYRYLPASTAYLPEPPELLARIAAAGFGGIRRRQVGLGAAQIITATRHR